MDKSGNNDIKNLFNSLNSFLIILPPDPDLDTTVAALSLHQALANNGKNSQLGYSGELPDLAGLNGLEELKNSIGNKNLHINLNFLEKDLEKVDYVVDHLGKFSLVIQPKSGKVAPSVSQINYSYSGADADLAIIFSASSLEELGALYAQEKHFLDNASKLLITNDAKDHNFTNHLVQNPGLNFVELIIDLIKRIDLKISAETANNLLSTLYKLTDSLKNPKVRPETFEIIAYLMRSGGQLPGIPAQIQAFTKSSFPQPPFFLEPPVEAGSQETPAQTKKDSIPTDWQAPKIFRSGS